MTQLYFVQILVQHIRAILPDLKARISTQMVTLQKELASYGELTESKVPTKLLALIDTRLDTQSSCCASPFPSPSHLKIQLSH